MRLDKTELILLGVAVLLAAAGLIAPQWLVFLLTMALAKSMVVQGVVMQMRAGLVTFGQGLYFCIGGYAVGMSGHFLSISDLPTLLLIGVGAAVALAMLLGLLMTRYREIFFAMLSLAFSMILYGMLVKSPALGSTDGFNVKAWSLFGWRRGLLRHQLWCREGGSQQPAKEPSSPHIHLISRGFHEPFLNNDRA